LQPSPGEGAIRFFADGASTGGRIQVSLKGATWNIDVAWLTGQVKLRRAGTVR
jgi:general secretion pathway protein H